MKVSSTVADAAKLLRGIAESTSAGSKKWNQFEIVCCVVLANVLATGHLLPMKEVLDDTE